MSKKIVKKYEGKLLKEIERIFWEYYHERLSEKAKKCLKKKKMLVKKS